MNRNAKTPTETQQEKVVEENKEKKTINQTYPSNPVTKQPHSTAITDGDPIDPICCYLWCLLSKHDHRNHECNALHNSVIQIESYMNVMLVKIAENVVVVFVIAAIVILISF